MEKTIKNKDQKRTDFSLFEKLIIVLRIVRLPGISRFFSFVRYIQFLYNARRTNFFLRNEIEGKRVLIIGSGPSATYVKNIPSDVCVLACKGSIKILKERNIDKAVNVYFAHKKNIVPVSNKISLSHSAGKELEDLVSEIPIGIFISESPKWARRYANQALFDVVSNNYYLRKIISPHKLKRLKGKGVGFTSTGTRLLQYAIFFGAKEIYLAGIDIEGGGYFWSSEVAFAKGHSPIDENFLVFVSKNFKNIFSLSPESPITKYFSFKKLL